MKMDIRLKDGTLKEIYGISWHPECKGAPGSCWMLQKDLKAQITPNVALYVKSRVAEPLDNTGRPEVDVIESADAPLEIYIDSEQEEPWRHNGLLLKTIPGMTA